MSVQSLPFYSALKPETKRLLKVHAVKESFAANTLLNEFHSALCEYLCIIVSGEIRAFKVNEDGQSITLYDIRENDLCLKNLNCVLNNTTYDALAKTKTKSEVLMIPKAIVLDVLMEDCAFQRFINTVLLNKMDTLVDHYEAISFAPVKKRLTLYLKKASHHFTVKNVYVTHQAIAEEINATREVISRELKQLEQSGMVTLKRGKIILHQPLNVM